MKILGLIPFLATFSLPAIAYFVFRMRTSRNCHATAINAIAVSILFVHLVGTTLVAFRSFHPMLVLLASVALFVPLLFQSAKNLPQCGVRIEKFHRTWIALIAVLAVSAIFRINPYNYSIGDCDPGMYIVGGKLISRTGSIVSHLPGISEKTKNICWKEDSYVTPSDLPSWHKSILHPISSSFSDSSKGRYEGAWTSAFFVKDATTGTVYPQFLSGWMVFIALSISWLGNAAAPWMLTVFSLLSLVFIAAIASRLAGKWAGIIAVAFAGTDWVLAYVSKLPVSETYFGFLFLLCLWTMLRMDTDEDGYDPQIIYLGAVYAMMTTRLNGIYLLPLLLTAPAIMTHRWPSVGKAMAYVGSLIIVFVAALVFDFETSFEYTYAHLCYFILGRCSGEVILTVFCGFMLGIAGLTILFRKKNILGLDLNATIHHVAPFAIIMAGIALLVSVAVSFAFPGKEVIYKGMLSEWRNHEGPRLLLFMSPVAVVLSFAYYFLVQQPKEMKETAIFALLFLYLWFFHCYMKQNHVPLPYGFRYYASDLLLVAHLLATVSIMRAWRLFDSLRMPVFRAWIGVIAIAMCIAFQLGAKGHRFMASYRAMEKTLPTLEATLQQFHNLMDRPIIVVDRQHPIKAMTSAFHAYGGVPVYEVSLEDLPMAMQRLNICRTILLTNVHTNDLPAKIRCLRSEKGCISINEIEQHIGNRRSSYKNIPWDGMFYLHVVEQTQ